MRGFPGGRSEVVRIGKFGLVGLLGVAVNMGMYALFSEIFGLRDFLARSIAIEISILHNFTWNFLWTWKERGRGWKFVPSRILKYHGATLFSSFGVTLAVGWVVLHFIGDADWARYASHLSGIGAGMVSNYLIADLWVFRKKREGNAPSSYTRAKK